MSFSYGTENCTDLAQPCRNGLSCEFYAMGTCKFSHGSNGEGDAFSNTPPRWNILTTTAPGGAFGGLGMASPKKKRNGPYTPFENSPIASDDRKQDESTEGKSSMSSPRVVLGNLTQGKKSGVANNSFSDHEQEGKEITNDDLPLRPLRIPCSWPTNALGMKGNDDVQSISSGEAMATASPDQSQSPDSKGMVEDGESPTDAFLRRMHEDEDFGQSGNVSDSCEGYAQRSGEARALAFTA